ncbi:DUF4145 domain-containing protein [Vibrio cholerae]
MQLRISSTYISQYCSVVTTCPVCGKAGSLIQIDNIADCQLVTREGAVYYTGQRYCPNHDCSAHIFFIMDSYNSLTLYPKLRIDFNSENIPPKIRSTFEEAVICHAERCYAASAIMVRRTLEELCQDKSCTGNNLFNRIENLKSSVVLPTELFAALHELRVLGNDAAHIESKDFDNIGEEEVSIAIEITKEILKSVYQMESLVNRLKSLKKA